MELDGPSHPARRRPPVSADRVVSMEQAVAAVEPGALVFLGGAGLVRKPMALARALAERGVGGLRLACFIGGPEVELLLAAGLVAEVHAAAVGLDVLGMAPNYRRARESGAIAAFDYSEGMLVAALEAGGRRLPFMPVRAGVGTSLPDHNPNLEIFEAPFGGGQLVAVRALRPDVAFLHAPQGDRGGRVRWPGDRLLDPLAAQAAAATYVSLERLVELGPEGGDLHRAWVTGVVEAPAGARPTACYPDYGPDLDAVRAMRG